MSHAEAHGHAHQDDIQPIPWLGKVGAIAVIRTFLSYFVGRDVREATEGAESSEAHH